MKIASQWAVRLFLLRFSLRNECVSLKKCFNFFPVNFAPHVIDAEALAPVLLIPVADGDAVVVNPDALQRAVLIRKVQAASVLRGAFPCCDDPTSSSADREER